MENLTKRDTPMVRQIFSIPPMVKDMFSTWKKRVADLLCQLDTTEIKQIFVTGCGDSFCAGVSARQMLEQFSQIPVYAIPAMELARYYPCRLTEEQLSGTLVLGISNSGRVPRVAEAVARLRQYGAATVALTASSTSPLADAAQYRLSTEIPSFPSSPGVRGYVTAMVSLALMGMGLGTARNRISQDTAERYEQDMLQLFDDLEQALPGYDRTAARMAEAYSKATSFEFCGTGHGYGSALFAREKLYEAAGVPSAVCDSEEWFHSFKFLRDLDGIPLMIFLDHRDFGQSRTEEMLERLQKMERAYGLISDGPSADAAYCFPLPKTETHSLLPLAEFAPPALLAAYSSAVRREPYSRGFQGRWQDFAETPSTVRSRIELV